MSELTTIPIMKETRDALKMLGMKGESYDALLRRLIETAKCQMLYRELDDIRCKGDYIKVDDIDAL
ncbi:MAG: hypothetical protein O8C58_05605 [Candidatus Methanoperedens sp.]|nr:hypothetical protein [Candidatus Methanoperedens sp.]